MDTSIVLQIVQLTVVILVAVLVIIQNRILKTQITKQKEIIQGMEVYTKLFDPNKFQLAVDIHKLTAQKEVEEKFQKEISKELEKTNQIREKAAKAITEMSVAIIDLLFKVYPKSDVEKIISTNFRDSNTFLDIVYKKQLSRRESENQISLLEIINQGISILDRISIEKKPQMNSEDEPKENDQHDN